MQEYIFNGKANLYLYCQCGYQATGQDKSRICDACVFLNDNYILDKISRKTLKQYYIFLKTFINLVVYW